MAGVSKDMIQLEENKEQQLESTCKKDSKQLGMLEGEPGELEEKTEKEERTREEQDTNFERAKISIARNISAVASQKLKLKRQRNLARKIFREQVSKHEPKVREIKEMEDANKQTYREPSERSGTCDQKECEPRKFASTEKLEERDTGVHRTAHNQPTRESKEITARWDEKFRNPSNLEPIIKLEVLGLEEPTSLSEKAVYQQQWEEWRIAHLENLCKAIKWDKSEPATIYEEKEWKMKKLASICESEEWKQEEDISQCKKQELDTIACKVKKSEAEENIAAEQAESKAEMKYASENKRDEMEYQLNPHKLERKNEEIRSSPKKVTRDVEKEMGKKKQRKPVELKSILKKPKEETEGLDKLSENFKGLLCDKESCDVTLKVKDKEYKAHRSVLIARSSVFAATFKHDTLERQTGVINISDCDPDSFQLFFEYLYSGKLEDLSPHSAVNLYYTSNKYDVEELKAFCVECLMQSLAVETVCEIAIFASMYDKGQLLSVVQDFFNKNFLQIFLTSEWKQLMENHCQLANKLLEEMAKMKLQE